jgi:uroporphyrinogen decarboxylase
MLDVLAGKETPRYPCAPLAVHSTAALAGVSLREYTLNPQVMAECIARYYETFQPDAVWFSADTWVTAEAMGARVEFTDDNQPPACVGEPTVQSLADVDAIPPPDPWTQGRQPLMLEALRLLRKKLGPEVFIIACFDQAPFSLACALLGMEGAMRSLRRDPALLQAVLARCEEHGCAYALALAEQGADLLSTGDSPASLVGPRFYREFALPAEQRLFAAIRRHCDLPLSLHICGDTTHILADMATAGSDVLEIDHAVPLEQACQTVPDTTALWGNLDPVRLLLNGTPADIESAATKSISIVRKCARQRYILSSGCTLAPATPRANLQSLLAAAHAAT